MFMEGLPSAGCSAGTLMEGIASNLQMKKLRQSYSPKAASQ